MVDGPKDAGGNTGPGAATRNDHGTDDEWPGQLEDNKQALNQRRRGADQAKKLKTNNVVKFNVL